MQIPLPAFLLIQFPIMEIQVASLRDLGALRRLESVCFEKDAWSLLDLVAVLSGFVAGDPRPAQNIGWIATIGVDPRYQRRGIGTTLLRACEQRMMYPRVKLTVRISNEGAISLYEKEGYRTVEIWKRYYNDGEDGLVMEKILDEKLVSPS